MQRSSIQLGSTCDCKVYLTVYDIIEVSFKPVLKEITSIVSGSWQKNELFGRYLFIRDSFSLIYFNENPIFRTILQKILQEGSQYFNKFKGIETECLVIPEVANHLLQPVIMRQPFLYKGFQTDILRQVYLMSCCFSTRTGNFSGLEPLYKNNRFGGSERPKRYSIWVIRKGRNYK